VPVSGLPVVVAGSKAGAGVAIDFPLHAAIRHHKAILQHVA
jgi:hypothetical protein